MKWNSDSQKVIEVIKEFRSQGRAIACVLKSGAEEKESESVHSSVVSVGRHNFAEPQYKDAKFIRRELKTYL